MKPRLSQSPEKLWLFICIDPPKHNLWLALTVSGQPPEFLAIRCKLQYIFIDCSVEFQRSQCLLTEITTVTLTMSLVLSRKNLTPTRIPAIIIATTTAHVTPMITCFRVTCDFLPSPASRLGSAYTTLIIISLPKIIWEEGRVAAL